MATVLLANVRIVIDGDWTAPPVPYFLVIAHDHASHPDSFSSWRGLPLLGMWYLDDGKWVRRWP